ncbi:MAG TPA: hypothetical protein PK289_00160 [Bacteroidia bacterium]|nr:hypothetical protein [Bacteroidia bacterium]
MKNDKHKLLSTARELRGTLQAIEDLLSGYAGIDGNENYVKYCRNKANQAHEDDDTLKQLYDDTYNVDMDKRKGINVAPLVKIIEKEFKLLDDIDTAGDMFKPKWCKFTKAVEQMHRLRWLVAYVEQDNKDENGVMTVNGNCYTKEERTALIF